MGAEYRQMLIDQRVHDDISSGKAILRKLSGRKLSSREVIEEFLGRRVRFLKLRKEIRDYINAFTSAAASERYVTGVMLFGSVARGSFGRHSDTDMLVVVEGNAADRFESINGLVNSAEPLRKALAAEGFNLRISPVLVSVSDLSSFRPMYIGMLEDGIVLFERNDTLFTFLNDIRRSVEYEKTIVNGTAMIKWRIVG